MLCVVTTYVVPYTYLYKNKENCSQKSLAKTRLFTILKLGYIVVDATTVAELNGVESSDALIALISDCMVASKFA